MPSWPNSARRRSASGTGAAGHLAALPPYHLAQLALDSLGAADGGSALLHLGALIAFTAGFVVIAGWGYWRDEGRTYG